MTRGQIRIHRRYRDDFSHSNILTALKKMLEMQFLFLNMIYFDPAHKIQRHQVRWDHGQLFLLLLVVIILRLQFCYRMGS